MRPTDQLLSLPNVSWAAEALELVFAVESRAVANHSVRSWAFARVLAEHESMAHEVDDALLFAATVLHDIGLRHDARAPVRFEVDGADYAAEFLTARQVAAGDVDRVWEAIALHTSPGIAERRGAAGRHRPDGRQERSLRADAFSDLAVCGRIPFTHSGWSSLHHRHRSDLL